MVECSIESFMQRLQKLFNLRLSADCLMKISESPVIYWIDHVEKI